VKRPLVLVIITVILVGLILLGLTDRDISVADTSAPDNEVTSGISKANNSSASAMIPITMHTEADE
jgi:hypothetical protein